MYAYVSKSCQILTTNLREILQKLRLLKFFGQPVSVQWGLDCYNLNDFKRKTFFSSRLHKKLANAYESGSLRRFALGRTDIIRSCSDATVKFLQSAHSKSNAEKALLLKNAISAHSAYSNDVLNFESFDRHLMGLKLTAIENKLDVPEIFKDTAFQKLCHYQISSSQVCYFDKRVYLYNKGIYFKLGFK
jgi:hypothetical protein